MYSKNINYDDELPGGLCIVYRLRDIELNHEPMCHIMYYGTITNTPTYRLPDDPTMEDDVIIYLYLNNTPIRVLFSHIELHASIMSVYELFSVRYKFVGEKYIVGVRKSSSLSSIVNHR
jgi:hypothetical protein